MIARFSLQFLVAADHINHNRVANYAAQEETKVDDGENDLHDEQKKFCHCAR